MTDYQNELVMEHLDLVNWVIRTRISVPNRPLLTYDDFYAIGCEAICRAALKYQADSGEFAPFACRYKVEPVGPSVDDAALAMIALRFLEGFLQKRCGVEISGSICSGLLGQKQR